MRAPAGQGEHRLKRQARERASILGHELGNFTRSEGRVISPTEREVCGWEARCQACIAMAIIRPARVPVDGGLGGTALRARCVGVGQTARPDAEKEASPY